MDTKPFRVSCHCSVLVVPLILQPVFIQNSEMSEKPNDSDQEWDNTPPEITNYANNITENLLPQKSKSEYEQYYTQFRDWQQKKKTDSFSENVLIAFFGDLLKKWKSSTLWKLYSILKTTINVKHDIDISRYKKLKSLLKRSSDNYVAKKSKIFTEENVKQFLEKASDETYLVTKVALVIGILGACRKNELYNIKISDIKDLGSAIQIAIPNTKTKKPREFTITGDFYNIVKKYWALRPGDVPYDNFFINFQKNKCTRQVIGINKLGNMPKQIATFLNLEKPQDYTGHCFRRTSATTLVNAGADITMLKRHGGWKSSQVAEGYIENSLQNKINVANQLVTSIIGNSCNSSLNLPSTSNSSCSTTDTSPSTNQSILKNITENISNIPAFNFYNCTNTINVKVNNDSFNK